MNKRHYEHTLPNIRGSLSNTYPVSDTKVQVLFHSSFAVRLKYAKQIKYFLYS